MTNVIREFTAPPNPYQRDGKWYWYDETGDESNPFDTEEEARASLNKYCDWLNNGGEL